MLHKLDEKITDEKVMCITLGYFVQRLLHALRKTDSLYNSILQKNKPGPCRRLTFAINLTTWLKIATDQIHKPFGAQITESLQRV